MFNIAINSLPLIRLLSIVNLSPLDTIWRKNDSLAVIEKPKKKHVDFLSLLDYISIKKFGSS